MPRHPRWPMRCFTPSGFGSASSPYDRKMWCVLCGKRNRPHRRGTETRRQKERLRSSGHSPRRAREVICSSGDPSGKGDFWVMSNAPEAVVKNSQRIASLAQSYEGQMVSFLRDLVAIPAESGHERPVVERIQREMEKVGFDEIRTDPMGNLLGRIGSGKKIIMMDSHTDAVGRS